MKGGRNASSRLSRLSSINNINKKEVFSQYDKNGSANTNKLSNANNTKLTNENNTNNTNKNDEKNSLEIKKKELIEMYGKYLDKDLLDKVFYNETTIHTLYNSLKTNNKEIIINISKNETITFK